MKAKILAVAIAGMIAAPLAMAADAGWYAGAGIGQTSTSGAGLTKTSDTAFRLLGGYKYNQNLAAEIEYVNLGSIQYQSLSLFDVKSSGFGIAAVGTLPLQNNFALYGRLGITSIKSDVSPTAVIVATGEVVSSNTHTGMTYGIGGEYAFSPTAAVRFGYDNYKIDAKILSGDVGTWMLSGVFRF
ncbi:MAG: porin family protein [Pseudomonadota bacterium]